MTEIEYLGPTANASFLLFDNLECGTTGVVYGFHVKSQYNNWETWFTADDQIMFGYEMSTFELQSVGATAQDLTNGKVAYPNSGTYALIIAQFPIGTTIFNWNDAIKIVYVGQLKVKKHLTFPFFSTISNYLPTWEH